MSLTPELSLLQVGSGPESEAGLGTLEKQLICPICLEIFNKPVVILPCQHNLCRKCANELYQPSLFQARTTMMVNSGRFRCPSCRQEVVLDRHGVYGLQRNLLVENIIDVYKQQISNMSNPASAPPPPAQPPAEVTCSDHEGEKLNIYCLSCQHPTCSLCKVFGAHQSCRVSPLMDVYQQQKDELSEGLDSLMKVNNKVQALISELEETCRTIEAMTQKISSEQEEKAGHTQSLVRCYGDSVEANSKLLERAMSSMDETDMAAFVQSSKELITKVMAATASCPTVTLKPGYENMRRYRFNFSQQQRALQSINFIKQELPEEPLEEPQEEPEPEEPKEPSIQNLEPKHPEEPSVQNLESNHLQEPSIQNLEQSRLEKLFVQNMEPQHLQDPPAQNLEPNHFQESSIQNLEQSHLQKLCIQNLEPQHLQEPSVQNLESVVEPVKELVPVLLFPSVEPVQSPSAAAVGLVKDSEEPAEEDLQPEDEGGLMKDEQKEREKPQAEEVQGGCGPVKEGNRGEHQEGMSMLQHHHSILTSSFLKPKSVYSLFQSPLHLCSHPFFLFIPSFTAFFTFPSPHFCFRVPSSFTLCISFPLPHSLFLFSSLVFFYHLYFLPNYIHKLPNSFFML
ncbi:tripartite motif-containing protein 55-like isoform X2 [Thalassophryne amazonica]|uniref:tripartite motif-containing protein 55-like isoform X2 n=1 Tax=Thalassophryne amazonica TaxID=390379 RepID=UPI001471ED52|nr:tripartite motif-containing protein 55-like isoform X2 [Thalassophryne amazonica]